MKLIGKTLLSVVALVIATMLAGAIVSKLQLSPPASPPGTAPHFLSMLLGSLVLIVGLIPIASGLGGRFTSRWPALALMLYITTGVNTVIELTIFSTLGGQRNMLAFYFVCFAMTAAVLAWQFGSQQPAPPLPRRATTQWIWRIAVAWLSFPVSYFLFGMCVAPIVIPIYQAGVPGLLIPPVDVILRTQLLRSLLFLGSSLPVVMLWTGSRRRLTLALGLAHTAMVGLYGLAQADSMPPVLRVTHSLEIAADSFVYALVLACLFFPRERVPATSSAMGITASSTPSAA